MKPVLNYSKVARPLQIHGPKYEPFVDGLRAVAVCAVIIFHLYPEGLRGGFVGVDIFFVISGYLITKQIREQIADNSFSIGAFYARRIRRITPPLIVMLLGVSVAAIIILKPEDMLSYAYSLLAQPFSLQNIVFLAEGEYFRGADTKPLLHTWSLAIEEQFYFIWPLILLMTKGVRCRSLILAVVVISMVSFLINNLLISISPKVSFFLLPTRAWELAAGGLVAILREYHAQNEVGASSVSFSLLGILLLFISLFWIDSTMAFPGVVCLLPVMGSFLLLLFCGQSALCSFLGSRPIVSIGLISYPLYLWHWPVLVFMHHLEVSVQTFSGLILFVTATAGLSVFSYFCVEKPIRQRIILADTFKLCLAFCSAGVVIVLFALHLVYTKGALYRFSNQAQPFLSASFDSQDHRCGFVFRVFNPKAEICQLLAPSKSNSRIFLWGNSHADMWSTALMERARSVGAGLWLNAKNCRGLADGSFCNRDLQKRIFEEMLVINPTDVILASSWYNSYGIPDDKFEAELREQVDLIVSQGVRVWIVVDIPASPQLDPEIGYRKNPLHPSPGVIATSEYALQHSREMSLFKSIQIDHPGEVDIIDIRGVFCDERICISGRENQIWYRDSNHLTNTGARVGVGAFDLVFTR